MADSNKIFDLNNAGTNAGLRLNFRRGQYAATVTLELSYENKVLRQDHRLTVRPASNLVDRLLIYSTSPLGDDVLWTERTSSTPLAAKRLPTNAPQRPILPKEGEFWLLRLPQPTSRPIEVSASIHTKWSKRALVPLLALPEATEQFGRILVRGSNRSTPLLEPIGLQPTPLPINMHPSGEQDNLAPVCAAFRYNPADCLDAARSAHLWAGPSAESGISSLIARHIQLESHIWPDGRGIHRATYELENHEASELKLGLPPEARLISASMDGHPLDVAAPIENAPPDVVHLSIQAQSATVSIYFETQGPPLTAGRELVPPLVLNELTFLAGDWTIWLPEEYSAAGIGISKADRRFNWRRRLFGPLGRPAGTQPFNPLRQADELSSVKRLIDSDSTESAAGSSSEFARPKRGEQTGDSGNRLLVNDGPTFGWNRYHEAFITSGPPPVIVMHPAAITAWAVVLMLSTFMCGRWLRRDHGELFTGALATTAGLALLLPAAYADLTAGAIIGLLLSLIPDRRQRSIPREDSVNDIQSTVAGALAVAIAVSLANPTLAQSPNGGALSQKSALGQHQSRTHPNRCRRTPLGHEIFCERTIPARTYGAGLAANAKRGAMVAT